MVTRTPRPICLVTPGSIWPGVPGPAAGCWSHTRDASTPPGASSRVSHPSDRRPRGRVPPARLLRRRRAVTTRRPLSRAPTADDAGYPVTVDNCGTEVALDAAPQRIVTIKSSTTELALALGVGDRLVGAAFLDGPFPDELAEAGAQVPVPGRRRAVVGGRAGAPSPTWCSPAGSRPSPPTPSASGTTSLELGVSTYVGTGRVPGGRVPARPADLRRRLRRHPRGRRPVRSTRRRGGPGGDPAGTPSRR